MFKIKWDPNNNGVILSEKIEDTDALNAPRPVYADEFRMLGLDEAFRLPENNVPICWETDRKYFYRGNVVAETKRGNIYEDPEVIVRDEYRGIILEPIDVNTLVKNNEKVLLVAENEAMDFIKEKYEEYQKNNIAGFVVAFSGGKDSQVILDLVSRVIPHEQFTPVFTNTGMELPCTLELMKITEEHYKQKYPGFKLEQAKSDRSALDMSLMLLVQSFCRLLLKS